MSDFRQALYQSYVTKFKIKQVKKETLKFILTWYEFKYLSLLAGLDRNSLILEFLKTKGFGRTTGSDLSEEQIKIAASRGDFPKNFLKDELLKFILKRQRLLKSTDQKCRIFSLKKLYPKINWLRRLDTLS